MHAVLLAQPCDPGLHDLAQVGREPEAADHQEPRVGVGRGEEVGQRLVAVDFELHG